ncbi:hypothetical protein DY000_02017226 [Brassica cretica]|uniref:Uncharacterized protein n=1 Tax=Brassica cretica TaxID=69181 RepID=A0ABQ7CTA8_BRACR|nr:hypothetical protein DY000_02017226 [Brassica cretica]
MKGNQKGVTNERRRQSLRVRKPDSIAKKPEPVLHKSSKKSKKSKKSRPVREPVRAPSLESLSASDESEREGLNLSVVCLFHREVSAIVVDLGLPTCKASYVGEDAPKAVFPSVKLTPFSPELGVIVVGAVAMDVEVDSSKTNSNSEDPKSEKGRDLVDNIWEHAFRSCLIIDPKEHPMLLAEPPLNTQQA